MHRPIPNISSHSCDQTQWQFSDAFIICWFSVALTTSLSNNVDILLVTHISFNCDVTSCIARYTGAQLKMNDPQRLIIILITIRDFEAKIFTAILSSVIHIFCITYESSIYCVPTEMQLKFYSIQISNAS